MRFRLGNLFGGRGTGGEPRGVTLPPPTQEHLHLRALLSSGFLLADDGTLSAALEVLPVDLTLADEGERIMWRERFATFVTSLRYDLPVQVVVATVPHRCEEYRDRVAERADHLRGIADEARRRGDEEAYARRMHMAELAEMHLSLMEMLLESLQPREERYLVVVWHNPFPITGGKRHLSPDKLREGEKEVERRLSAVAGFLRQAGLEARRLDDEELLEMVYSFYHMTMSPLTRAERPSVLAGAVVSGDLLEEGGVWEGEG